ncbi:archaetidylinositol phosphate synthase [Methanosalsum natronophilum]|uniref:archaetidylinositol phosphate synthase n=1 Tax=Methanosalsum natronophilum TaxID=768733 RepID=UPI00216A4878|nr:archaetidylinositol phosphate synthase [Methanosalsum natronophilum]MCS3923726.1 CDP-diacylglycerol--glycerol-3-phosphate 3-phosphatidyltransferase/archaetidylinositol phosphate synthase [Methanosalsum natronophilum]
MTFNDLRPVFTKFIEPFAKTVAEWGISPNLISGISLIFAVLAGITFYYSLADPRLMLLGGIFVALNSFLDALDGSIARYMNKEGPKGDFLDHVIDRYADAFIILGIVAGGFISWALGTIAIIGVLITSYLGTQAQALGLGRFYGGIMGRADRLVLIMAASIVYYLYPYNVWGLTAPGWSILLIAIGSHITALQRIHHIWNNL